MKRIFIILIVSSFGIACNNKDNNVKTKNIIEVDSSEIRKSEAMTLLDEANSWMEKGIKKEASKAKINDEINPRMEKYQKLLKTMNKKDSTEIQNYRIEKINELIDLQIKQN